MAQPVMAQATSVLAAVILAASVGAAACRDVPAPEGGVLALSPVLLPSPGVVAGDTMRDSLGQVAPLRMTAFDVNGVAIEPAPATSFATLDAGAHLAGAFLIGDAAGTSVRLVGLAAGLQSQTATAIVTLRPDTLVPADSTRHVRQFSLLGADTLVTSADLSVLVQHRAGASVSGVDAVIVRYSFDRTVPATSASGVALVSGTLVSSRDTTTNGGRAARAVRLNTRAASIVPPDSAVVRATASYRGQTIGVVVFTIVFTNQ